MFMDSFKYYKARNPVPDFKDVIDVDVCADEIVRETITNPLNLQTSESLGLVTDEEWSIFKFKKIPGLILIRNPFTSKGQRFWILKCLTEYSKKPNKLNIDFDKLLKDDENWWQVCYKDSKRKSLLNKLRWATLGYHHNWDTKVYSESSKSEMPDELSRLTKHLAELTNFENFNAEAAIINYYRMNSTLAGHTDHSEHNFKAPLFSISFGQSAVFLIGGLTKDDAADAVYLRSGDVVIMSGESRLRYHGVPKIVRSETKPWLVNDFKINEDWENAKSYIDEARININVRQVLMDGQKCL